MSDATTYSIEIDDLPAETIGASGDAELIEKLRAMMARESLSHIGGDVHVRVTRPDGSSLIGTVAELRSSAKEAF